MLSDGSGSKPLHLVGEIRSCHESKMRSTSTLYVNATRVAGSTRLTITVTLPFITLNIPVVYIFALLGVPACDVTELVLGDMHGVPLDLIHMVSSTIDGSHSDMTRDQIVDYIGREGTKEMSAERRVKYVEHILMSEFIPHQSLDKGNSADLERARFLALLIRKICTVAIGIAPADERDHYACKRVDSSGQLMSLLFRQLYRNYLKSVTMHMHKLVDTKKIDTANLTTFLVDKRISSGFRYAFATGTWGIQKTTNAQTGVAQVIGRLTAVAGVSNMRRVNVPINRDGKSVRPRQLHRTSYGIICCSETPEGGACGLVRNLALLAHVRLGCMSSPLFDVLACMSSVQVTPIREATPRNVSSDAHVFVNGRLHGYVPMQDLHQLREDLRALRGHGDIPFDTSLAIDGMFFHISTDAGALLRPVVRLDRLSHFMDTSLTFDNLVVRGAIEYIDKHEEENCCIATSVWAVDASFHTHVDMHPAMIHGICAGLIPFANHDQAPRVVYQAAMCKQAIGLFAMNYMLRIDSIAHVLMYPQRPLVTTRVDDVLSISSLPAAQVPIVCIMAYTGFNQEDSVIACQTAIDNGFLRSMYLRSYKDQETNTGIDAARFGRPPADCGGIRAGNYDQLGEDGLVKPGQKLEQGSAVIGKTMNICNVDKLRKSAKRDRSVLVKCNETQTVDAVFTTRSKDGHLLAKVRTRSVRVPQIGDKVSSRHGQKGIISTIMAREDMPVTKDGITPDIIINPHAIPSRMTVAHLIETLLGKACTATGKIGDGTPFCGVQVEDIASELEARGYEKHGAEELINGMTGERMTCKVFIGPVTYQRLKHMSIDKKHARGQHGPVQVLTRQPVEGKSRDGGLRFGEMERDCFISHGVAANLKERLFEQSDAFMCTLCSKCGFFCHTGSSNFIVRNSGPYCSKCKTGKHAVKVGIPFATKLFTQELQSLMIAPLLKLTHSSIKSQDTISMGLNIQDS